MVITEYIGFSINCDYSLVNNNFNCFFGRLWESQQDLKLFEARMNRLKFQYEVVMIKEHSSLSLFHLEVNHADMLTIYRLECAYT